MNESNLDTALIAATPPARTESRMGRRDGDGSFGEHLAEAGRDRQDTSPVDEPKADDLRSPEAKQDSSRKDDHTADSVDGEREDRVDANEEPVQVDDGAESEDNPTTDAASDEPAVAAVASAEVANAVPENDTAPEAVPVDTQETQVAKVHAKSKSPQTGHERSTEKQSKPLPPSLNGQPAVETKEQVQNNEAPTAATGKDATDNLEPQAQTLADDKAGNTEKAPRMAFDNSDTKQQTTSKENNQAEISDSEQHVVEHDTTARSSPAAEQASSASPDANTQKNQGKQETRSTSRSRNRRSEALSRAGAGGRAEQVDGSSKGALPGSQTTTAEVASLLETNSKETALEPNAASNDQGDSRPSTPTPVSRPLDFTSSNAMRADAGTSAKQPRIDPERFVTRVAKAFRLAEDRGGQLRLRLSPPELGSVRLELAVKNGAVTATVETETAAARNVLLDNLPALRDRLAEQNIRVEQFDVHVRDEGANGKQEHTMDNQGEQYSPESGNERSNTQGQGDSASSRMGRQSAISRGDETLNVMV